MHACTHGVFPFCITTLGLSEDQSHSSEAREKECFSFKTPRRAFNTLHHVDDGVTCGKKRMKKIKIKGKRKAGQAGVN